MRWSERSVSIGSGQASLYGTLSLPIGTPPASGVLIIAGSGPVDRDGNLPAGKNDSLRQLAQALSGRGIATLRVDKRGIAESAPAGPDESDLRFSTFVDDARRWLDFLCEELRIGHCALVGHSEGALVATLAAQQSNVSRLILIAGLGRPAGRAILDQLRAAGLPFALLDSAQRTLSFLVQGQSVADSAPELHALFRPSVQPYLISWFRLDPAAELAKIGVPTLIVHGTNDLQVSAAEGQLLAACGSHAKSVIISGMNHILKRAPSDRAANFATYNDADLPIAPELVEVVADFLR